MEGLSKKEKGLMDMDNSVVMAGGRGHKGIKWQWEKKKVKNKVLKKYNMVSISSLY